VAQREEVGAVEPRGDLRGRQQRFGHQRIVTNRSEGAPG
jgi:hypothetical protein